MDKKVDNFISNKIYLRTYMQEQNRNFNRQERLASHWAGNQIGYNHRVLRGLIIHALILTVFVCHTANEYKARMSLYTLMNM